jgi:hypothetical protein
VRLVAGAGVGRWRRATVLARTTALRWGPTVGRGGPKALRGGPRVGRCGPKTLRGGPRVVRGGPKTLRGGPNILSRRTEGVLRVLSGFRHAGRMGMGRKNRSGSVPEGVRRGEGVEGQMAKGDRGTRGRGDAGWGWGGGGVGVGVGWGWGWGGGGVGVGWGWGWGGGGGGVGVGVGVGVAMIGAHWRVFGITSRPPSPHVRSGCRSRPTGSGWRRSGCWGS